MRFVILLGAFIIAGAITGFDYQWPAGIGIFIVVILSLSLCADLAEFSKKMGWF